MKVTLNKYTLQFENKATEIKYKLFSYPRIISRYRTILLVAFVFNILFIIRNHFSDFAPSNTTIRLYYILPLLGATILYLSKLQKKDTTSYFKHFQSFIIFTAIATIALHTWIVYYEPMEAGKNIAYTMLVLLPAFTLLSGISLTSTISITASYVFIYFFVIFNQLEFSYHDVRIEVTTIIEVIIVVTIAKYYEDKSLREIFISNQQLASNNLEIAKTVETLIEKNEFQRTLIGYLAHDVRSPMNNLKGIMKLVNLNLPEKDLKGVLKNLEIEFGKTDTMLNNLLYWIKSQTEGFNINIQPIEIKQLLLPMVELYQGIAKEKEIDIKTNLDENATVLSDKFAMEAVIRNLLSNSIKYCKVGDTIEVTTKVLDRTVIVFINDTGIGMHKEILAKITSPQRYSEIKKDSFGLGLQICREMLLLHRSSMEITSEQDKGTMISFELNRDLG